MYEGAKMDQKTADLMQIDSFMFNEYLCRRSRLSGSIEMFSRLCEDSNYTIL